MESNTRVESRIENNVGIMDISGEVTSFAEKILEDAYEKLSTEGNQKIAMNFQDVAYINSAGMAIIISILTKSRNRKQTLACWGLTDHFQKIFDMVGITKYMKHYKNEETTLKAI